MKKFIVFFMFCFSFNIVFAQEHIIYLLNGEILKSSKIKIIYKGDETTYIPLDASVNKTVSIKKDEIFIMESIPKKETLFKTRTVWFFNDDGIPYSFPVNQILKMDLAEYTKPSVCMDGIKECHYNYRGNGAYVAGLIPGFVLWPAGLVSSSIIGNKPVKEKHLNLDPLKTDDMDYTTCYRITAQHLKKEKVWSGWATGFSIALIASSIVIASGF